MAVGPQWKDNVAVVSSNFVSTVGVEEMGIALNSPDCVKRSCSEGWNYRQRSKLCPVLAFLKYSRTKMDLRVVFILWEGGQ